LFKSSLQKKPCLPNPTNGSWWIVQVQPTKEALSSESHQRQLVDCSNPTYKGSFFLEFPQRQLGDRSSPAFVFDEASI
jgi:hypothetical protein